MSDNKITAEALQGFSDEQLYEELKRRNVDKELLSYKTLNIDGFTPKDLVCMQGNEYEEECDEYGPYYYFYLKADNKLFDIYYMNCVTQDLDENGEEITPSQWPQIKDGDYSTNGAMELVPPEFVESSENQYEYHGKSDVKEYLKKCGITDFRIWDETLKNEETGIDRNYEGIH